MIVNRKTRLMDLHAESAENTRHDQREQQPRAAHDERASDGRTHFRIRSPKQKAPPDREEQAGATPAPSLASSGPSAARPPSPHPSAGPRGSARDPPSKACAPARPVSSTHQRAAGRRSRRTNSRPMESSNLDRSDRGLARCPRVPNSMGPRRRSTRSGSSRRRCHSSGLRPRTRTVPRPPSRTKHGPCSCTTRQPPAAGRS